MGLDDYKGLKTVVVGCASGIGRAAAEGLVALGSRVHGLDVKVCDLPLASFARCDTREPAAIDEAVAAMGDGIDAFFYCSGLPQTKPPLDVHKVNFLGMRHMVEAVRPRVRKNGSISIIASTAGNGWVRRPEVIHSFIDTPDFAAGVAWLTPKLAELGDPYMFSKEAVIVWMMKSCARYIKSNVRLNCLSPGPTITGMTPDFDSFGGPALIDVYTQPLGRRSSPEEQAWPLIFLGSPAASYINGCNFITDAGFTSAMATGQLDLEKLIAAATRKAS
jgi:NAD(P)-dependent dehydrogenase (short-subunit alcohol dehydrogenase family)